MTVKKDYSIINKKFDERFDYMTAKHNKVTFFRFDVRYPEDHPHDGTNRDFSELLKQLKEPLTKIGNEMHYAWCREKETSENPHYHVAILLNGSYTQRVDGILQNANGIWGNIVGSPKKGLIDYCNRFSGERVAKQIRIDRPSSKKEGEELAQQQQEFEANKVAVRVRAHYLGKSDQKGDVPKRVREYGASELPKAGKR